MINEKMNNMKRKNNMKADSVLREQLHSLLFDRNAHQNFAAAVNNFPQTDIDRYAENVPYSPWQLIEHIRIAQWDIVEFMINPKHISPKFPDGYWPDRNHHGSWSDWLRSLSLIEIDFKRVKNLIGDRSLDLFSEIPHAPGYTYLREILLIADHNAYHIGGLVNLRRLLRNW